MPQEFQCLRCCECATFQVHQVKKVKKWTCKICNVKQSIIKVFGQGTGAECRSHVQKLNMMRQEFDDSIPDNITTSSHLLEPTISPDASLQCNVNGEEASDFRASSPQVSKWNLFVETENDYDDEDDDGNDDFKSSNTTVTTCRITYDQTRKGTKRKSVGHDYSKKSQGNCSRSPGINRRWDGQYNASSSQDHGNRPSADADFRNHNGFVCDVSSTGNSYSSTDGMKKQIEKNPSVSVQWKPLSASKAQTNLCGERASSPRFHRDTKASDLKPVINSSKWSMFIEKKDDTDEEQEEDENVPSISRASYSSTPQIQPVTDFHKDQWVEDQFTVDGDLDDIIDQI